MINKRRKTGWIKWVLVILVMLVLLVLALPTLQQILSGSGTSGNRQVNANIETNTGAMTENTTSARSDNTTTTQVKRGSLSVAVSGSGKLSPVDSGTVFSETEGRVLEVGMEVGDAVKQGDVLIRLGSSDLETTIASLQRELFDAQIALGEVRDSGSATSLYSPTAGRVKMMVAEVGDDVAMIMKEYGYLCVISRDGKMKIEFELPTGTSLNVGDKVTAWIDNVAVEGTVDQLTGLTSGSVSVTVADDTYEVGEPVSVTTLFGEKLGEGTLQVNMPIPVTGIGGTISNVYYEDDDSVGSGYRLFYLEGRTPSSDLQKAVLVYDEARVALESAQEKQDGLTIRAPMSGVIATVNTSVGAKLEEGSEVFSIQSNDNFKVTASVDELDIVHVTPGQSVSVEIDAYPNQKFNAIVQSISGKGTVEGGVATYDVTARLDESAGFMDGMTANIEVATVEKSGVLLLPVEAISTSNNESYVTLSTGMQSRVTTGASDGTNIEILTGVNEGDSVLVTKTANSGSVGSYSGASSTGTGNRGNYSGGMGNIGMMPGGF